MNIDQPTEEVISNEDQHVSDLYNAANPHQPTLEEMQKALASLPSNYQKYGRSMWYKLNNIPGSIKAIGGTDYLVSSKGPWIKASTAADNLPN